MITLRYGTASLVGSNEVTGDSMIVCVDLGTTHSAVAHINHLGKPEILAGFSGEQITPSLVPFQGEDQPGVSTAKRSAATSLDDCVQDVKRSVEHSSRKCDSLEGATNSLEGVSALISNRMVDEAESIPGEGESADALITVPASLQRWTEASHHGLWPDGRPQRASSIQRTAKFMLLRHQLRFGNPDID